MRTARGTSSPGGCTRTFAWGSESTSFIYDDQYLANPGAYQLDPALPLVAGTLQTPVGRALFGGFADSLPDRWGRTLIQRAERARAQAAATAPRSMSEIDLLLGVRDDLREGALRFRRGGQGSFLAAEASGIPVLTDLPALLDIAARAERDAADYRGSQAATAGSAAPWVVHARRHTSWTVMGVSPLRSSPVKARTPGT